MYHKKALGWCWVVLLLGWAAPSPLLCQPKESLAKAKVMFEQGETYYKAREFERSLYFYREAYLLSLEPSMLFNMGQCYRQLGMLQEASESYRAFLRDSSATHVLRPKAELLLAEVEAELLKKAPATAPTSAPQSQATTAPTSPPASLESTTLAVEPKTQAIDSLPATMLSPLVPPRAPIAHWLLYGGGALSGFVAVGVGAVALSTSVGARDLQGGVGFDVDELTLKHDKARRLGVISDLFLLSSASLVVSGYLLHKKSAAELR